MANVFLSYSREDRDFALQLVGAFKVYKISFWLDDRIASGEEWWKTIEAEIVGCQNFVVVMSPDAAASRWVSREIHLADHHEKTIHPVLLRGNPFSMFLDTQITQVAPDGLAPTHFFESLSGNEIAQPQGLRSESPVGPEEPLRALRRRLKGLGRPLRSMDAIRELAATSAPGDSWMGDMITKAMEKVGFDGTILVEEGCSVSPGLEIFEGARFEGGFLSPYFMTDESANVVAFDSALIVLCSEIIGPLAENSAERSSDTGVDMSFLMPLLEESARSGEPIIFVAAGFHEEALAMLVMNARKGSIRTCAVQAQADGDEAKYLFSDLSTITGAQVLGKELARDTWQARKEDLGSVGMVRIFGDRTIVTCPGELSAEHKDRVIHVRRKLEHASSSKERKVLSDSLVRLVGGVAMIRAGGFSKGELERNTRVAESSVCVVQEALKESFSREVVDNEP